MARATCNKCGATHEGDWNHIRKALTKCCKQPKKKSPPLVVTPTLAAPPELPYVISWPGRIQSQNDSQYSHWNVYARYKSQMTRVLRPLLRDLQGLQIPYSRWSLVRQYAGRMREMDFGNLVGGCKPIPDILQERQVIVDDKPANFSCEYSQRRGDEALIILTLLEVGDAPAKVV